MGDIQIGNAPIDTRRGVAIRITILDEQKQLFKQQSLVRVTNQNTGRAFFQTASGLEVIFADLPPGKYFIELAIPELADKLTAPPGPDGKPGKLRASFTVAAPEGEEMVELATNWPLLEELAAKSGGKVFTAENASELVELLTRQTAVHVEHHEFRLWQWWVTLAAFLVLLTLEWVARKMAGLP